MASGVGGGGGGGWGLGRQWGEVGGLLGVWDILEWAVAGGGRVGRANCGLWRGGEAEGQQGERTWAGREGRYSGWGRGGGGHGGGRGGVGVGGHPPPPTPPPPPPPNPPPPPPGGPGGGGVPYFSSSTVPPTEPSDPDGTLRTGLSRCAAPISAAPCDHALKSSFASSRFFVTEQAICDNLGGIELDLKFYIRAIVAGFPSGCSRTTDAPPRVNRRSRRRRPPWRPVFSKVESCKFPKPNPRTLSETPVFALSWDQSEQLALIR
jgi:hypothetical protein